MVIGNRIKIFREQLNMSQRELSDLLGISRQAVSQIENDERKISAEELKKLAEIFGVKADNILNLELEPEVVLEKQDKEKKDKQRMRISVPQENLDKFKEVLLYILNKVGSKSNIGETVIYKLLYFCDFDYYEIYEEQLIGAKYQKNHFGPTPIEFKKIVEEMIENEEITIIKNKYFKYPQTKYLPLKKCDLSKLKANELKVVDDVLNRLSDMNASQISGYSHSDVPWLTTETGDIIDYESVFYREPCFSVRKYEEDIQ
jgi:transcriptional regulator with XRE-family HTH domain